MDGSHPSGTEPVLSGHQTGALRDAICDAFDLNTLDQMVKLRLDKNRPDIVATGDLKTVVFDLIGVARREGWSGELIRAAYEYVPGNLALRAFLADNPGLVAALDLDVTHGPTPLGADQAGRPARFPTFPGLNRARATLTAAVVLIAGGTGFTACQMREQSNPPGTPPTRESGADSGARGGVFVGGNVTGDGNNFAGRDVIVNPPPPKKTVGDLRITGVRRGRGGVTVTVLNAGPAEVEAVKGTITAQVIPEHVTSLNGTPLDLIPTAPRIAPNGTVELSARSSDSSIWYVTEIKVWGERNDDQDTRNSHYTFSRSTNAFIIPEAGRGTQSWGVAELERMRSN